MYNNKYKDRSPQETIEIIYNFFIDKGFDIKIAFVKESLESKTWTSTIQLFFKDNKVLSANGKGVSRDFCLASGFGELYERFCNKIFVLSNPFAMKKYLDNNYCLDKREKILTEKEVFGSFKFQNHLNELGGNYIYLLKQYYNLIYNNKYIGVPFFNILNQNEKLYLDPRMLLNIVGSSGMCAGNNFKEAFNQGFSEILEHYLEGIFRYKIFDNYKVLDIDKINNSIIIKIVEEIRKNGNEIYVIDFSYLIDFPVLMAILVNKETQMITKNIGCFPIFDIALERCLTELYQGDIDRLKFLKTEGFVPFKTETAEFWENLWPGLPSLEETFPEFILKNLCFKNTPNEKVFLFDKTISNEEIFQYYLNLCKNKNLEVYYWDNSQINEITSLWIYVDNLSGLNYRKSSTKEVVYKQKILNFGIELFKILNNFIVDNKLDLESFKNLIKIFHEFNHFEKSCILNCLLFNNWFEPYESTTYIIFKFFYYLLFDNFDVFKNKSLFCEVNFQPFLGKIAKKYLLLERYLLSNNYNLEEILFSIKFLGIDANEQDINNYYNNRENFIIEYFNILKEKYNSPEYLNYLSII